MGDSMVEVGMECGVAVPDFPPDPDDPCWGEESYDPPVTVTAAQVLDRLEGHRRLIRFVGCQELVSTVEWALKNPGTLDPSPVQVLEGRERSVRYGGDGTPLVAEFAAAELAVATHSTTWAASRLVADALDACYRLPRVWRRVLDGEVEAWQVRKIAHHTRHLSVAAAAQVDVEIADLLGTMSWGRLEPVLAGRTIAADPAAAVKAAEHARAGRYVAKGRHNVHGVTHLHANLDAADATWLDATLDLLADLLHTRRGDTTSKDVRRAAALGLLAHPTRALELLTEPANPAPLVALRQAQEPPATSLVEPGRDVAPPREVPDDLAADPEVEPVTPRVPRDHPGFDPDPVEPVAPWQPWAPADPADAVRHHPAGFVHDPAHTDTLARLTTLLSDPAAQRRCRPAAVLHLHLAAETLTTTGTAAASGVARVEKLGPVDIATIRRWLDQTAVRVLPVVDLPAGQAPVDSYEIPDRIRRDLTERCPVSLFPYSSSPNLSVNGLDLDHTGRFDHGSQNRPPPPGQTGIDKLVPAARYEHRVFTHAAGWERRQPRAGMLYVRTPHGRVYLSTTSHGTHDLGTGTLANAIWATVR